MKNDIERMSVLFHNRAGEIMRSLYGDFKHSVAHIDRQGEENVFQQQLGKFSALLRSRLGNIAVELMGMLDTGAARNEWSHTVNGFIEDYLHEFGQKVRSL